MLHLDKGWQKEVRKNEIRVSPSLLLATFWEHLGIENNVLLISPVQPPHAVPVAIIQYYQPWTGRRNSCYKNGYRFPELTTIMTVYTRPKCAQNNQGLL